MLILTVLIYIIVGYAIYQLNQWRKLPPGPFPFLFLGNVPQMIYGGIKYGGIVETMRVWTEYYGNVHTMWMGPIPMVNICDYETTYDVMMRQGNKTIDRYTPHPWIMTRTGEDQIRGNAFSNGVYWDEHRRFALKTLRGFGLGQNIMEQRIMEEFEFQFADIEHEMVNGSVSVKMNETADMLVGSIINRLLFGYRFDRKRKEKFFSVKRNVDKVFTEMTAVDMIIQPWFRHIPIINRRYYELYLPQVAISEFIKENIAQRESELASGEHLLEGEGDDFMDAYFIEQAKRKANGDEDMFDDFGLQVDLYDLWTAGQETTSLTLCWAFILLLENPTVIERCRKEVEKCTNRNRDISLLDRTDTPYINATIQEINRLAAILNVNVWRCTNDYTECGKYMIPPNTVVSSQISVICSREEDFEDPYKFNPDRFIVGGRALEQKNIIFGIGKRACLGEALARAELYLLIANMILRYDFAPDPEMPPRRKANQPNGIFHRPHQFKMIITKL